MIKYNFYRNEINRPQFGVDREFSMLWEWGSLPRAQVVQAIEDIEAVKAGKLDKCFFGYDITGFSYYSPEGNEDYAGKAYIDYEEMNEKTRKWEDASMEVPVDDIYNLMKDWLAYIEEWEKETGLKKK